MKYLLLTCICFLFSSVFGQLQEVYLQIPDQELNVLPYLSNAVVVFDPTPTDCPFKQEIDSISGEKVIVTNPSFDATGLNPSFRNTNQYCYLGYPYESLSVDLPPFLDSLNDGIYCQFYDQLLIRDKDTLKWKDRVVAAIFEVKNNQPIGEVRWYYPNGLLMQKGIYTNGLRDGEWFIQYINDLSSPSKKKKSWRFDHSTTINYANGKKNGLEYSITKSWISDKDNGPVEETWQRYQSDIPHGKYEHRINGQPRTTGEYNNGKPSGTWTQYQWKDSIEGGKLIPRLVYTYSTDSTPVRFPAYLRDRFTHLTLLNGKYMRFSEPYSFYDDYKPDRYTYQSIGDGFSSYYEVPNCCHFAVGYNYDPTNIPSRFSSYQFFLKDSLGKRHFFEDITDTCGVLFRFSGILEEYYPNGQLKLHFDFSHPETLLNNTVYWQNGKPMNRFRKTALENDWEQLWYSETGEVIEHIIYDSLFKFKAKPVDPNYLIVNGKTYSKSGDLLFYTNWKSIPYSETQPVLITEQRMLKNNHPIEQFYFYPSQRTGFKALGLDKHYKHVKWYTFDSTFRSVHFIDTVSFGQLFSVVEFNDSIRNELWYQYHQPIKNDTIHSGVIPFGDLFSSIKMRALQYNGKPYTGKLIIHFGNQSQPHISKTKTELVISLNRKNDLQLLYLLFPNISALLIGNNLEIISNPPEKEFTKVLPELELKTIELNLTDGIINGELSCYAPDKRPLAQLQYLDGQLSGTQNYYNRFPDSYRSFRSGFYYRSHNDELIENYKRVQLTQQLNYKNGILNGIDLRINLNGDTTEIYNYLNGSWEGEQFAIDDDLNLDFSVYKNDTLLAEKKEDSRTRKTLFEWSIETEIYRSFHKNGQLAQEFIDRNEVYDTIRCYDTLGFLSQKICLANRLLDFAIFYENGERSLTIDFAMEDSLVYPFNENGFIRYPIVKEVMKDKTIYGTRVRLYDSQYSGYTKKYNQYNELEEEGMLYNGMKIGDWHYYGSQKSGHYCIHFSDSSDSYYHKERIGSVSFYDEQGIVVSKGELLNYSKEYNCLQRNYNERFAVNYELYNTMIPPDSLMHIIHFYKTGVKMNEGFVLNGRAQGLWRWYHSDGSLFGLGNYEDGKRNGRWLEGDLSQLNFLGEYCLDPDNSNYTNLLKDLAVTVIYYDHGTITEVQEHQFRGTK
jgi:antitoxin component YwqK of YwqJK toxin-antitoxin module